MQRGPRSKDIPLAMSISGLFREMADSRTEQGKDKMSLEHLVLKEDGNMSQDIETSLKGLLLARSQTVCAPR